MDSQPIDSEFISEATPVHSACDPDETSIGGSPEKSADLDTTLAFAPASSQTPAAAKRQIGRYDILGEIARGGMGVVYRAFDRQLDRLVALKLIKSGELADADQIERFQTEAKAAAQLDHPGIVQVYEVGQVGNQHFMAMAFIDGHSLWQEVQESPLAPKRAAKLMQQVAEAVQYAHDRGIVHRDLKPQNILLTKDGQPKVTDFGLAKRQESDSNLTETGQALGTPSYMPPEQAQGKVKDIGLLSDVYSLGATLYCLLTGRPPFQAATQLETMLQVVEQEPVSPKSLNRAVSVDLETICLRCLEKEPARRYATARLLAEDLGRQLRGEPTLARPVSTSERVWRWCLRNRRLALLGTSTLVAALAMLIVSAAAYVRVAAALHSESLALSESKQKTTDLGKAVVARDTALSEKEGALQQREAALHESQMALANVEYVRAIDACNDGDISLGLLHAVQSLRSLPESEAGHEFGQAVRATIANYRPQTLGLVQAADLGQGIVSCGICDDELFAASGHADGSVRLWDTTDWHLLEPPMQLSGAVVYVRFAPGSRSLVAITEAGLVHTLDATTRKRIGTPFQSYSHLWNKHSSTIRQRVCDFSGDGRLAVVPLETGVRVWSIKTGEVIHDLGQDAKNTFNTRVTLNADGTRCAVSFGLGDLRVWNLDDTAQPAQRSPANFNYVNDLEFVRHEKQEQLATVGMSNCHLLSVGGSAEWQAISVPAEGRPLRCKNLTGRSILALGGFWGDIQLRSAFDLRPVDSAAIALHPRKDGGSIYALQHLAFDRNSGTLATAHVDGSIRLWATPSLVPIGQPLRLMSPAIELQFLSSTGDLAVVTQDYPNDKGTVRLFSQRAALAARPRPVVHSKLTEPARDGQRLGLRNDNTLEVHDENLAVSIGPAIPRKIISITLSLDARFAAALSEDSRAHLWEREHGQWTSRELPESGLQGQIENGDVQFSADGSALVILAGTSVTALKTVSREWFPIQITGLAKPPWAPVMHVDAEGKAVFLQARDRLTQYDLNSGQIVQEILERAVLAGETIPRGWLLTSSNNSLIRRQLANGSRASGSCPVPGDFYKAILSPDGKRLAVLNYDGRVRILDAQRLTWVDSLGEMIQPMDVWAMGWDANGTRLVTGGLDKTIRVWNALTGESLTQPILHEGQVVAATFLHDRDYVLSASTAPELRLVHVPTGKTAAVWRVPHGVDQYAEELRRGTKPWTVDVIKHNGAGSSFTLLPPTTQPLEELAGEIEAHLGGRLEDGSIWRVTRVEGIISRRSP